MNWKGVLMPWRNRKPHSDVGIHVADEHLRRAESQQQAVDKMTHEMWEIKQENGFSRIWREQGFGSQ